MTRLIQYYQILTRVIQLKCKAVTNSQYSRTETIKIDPVPVHIYVDVLKENECKALLLTRVKGVSCGLQICHGIKKWYRVIVKCKYSKKKQSLNHKRKNLGTKSQKVLNLKFSGRLFVTKGMSHKN